MSSLKANFLVIALVAAVVASGSASAVTPNFSKLFEAVSDTVVDIKTSRVTSSDKPPEQGTPDGEPAVPMPPWEEFFRRHRSPEESRPQPERAGSGLIISENEIITNYHIVKGANEIVIRLQDRREMEAEMVGFDEVSDIALLKVEADDLTPAKIGSSDDLKVGQWVMAIGTPFGFKHTVTKGIVSAKDRSLPNASYIPFIQTDVPINPGNSGGPLFNLDKEVVGINSQIYTRTGSFSGLSFAIPADLAMEVVEQLRDDGKVERGWLGVFIQNMTWDLARSFGMKDGLVMGAIVSKVIEDSPAEDAGIKSGDVILKFDGKPIGDSSELPPLVGRTQIGEDVEVEILRDDETLEITVEIGELEADQAMAQVPEKKKDPEVVLGMTLRELNKSERDKPALSKGGLAVVKIDEGVARDAGVILGDVLIMLGNKRFDTIDEFRDVLEDIPSGRFVTLLVIRSGVPRYLALRTH